VNREIVEAVRLRAGGRCEYCRMPQAFYKSPFQIDHIVARKHGGKSVDSKLAFVSERKIDR
jgi:hypothetical protein